MAVWFLIALSLCGFTLSPAKQTSKLEAKLQELVNGVVANASQKLGYDLGMQIGWYSPTEQFTVVAGRASTGPSGRRLTASDTFLYGSGTKPFTAAAVMRLIDQGKLKASDYAYKHIDPFLYKSNGTTMAELFGDAITNATVLDLIRMSAGIPDFEGVGATRDADVLNGGSKNWPVYGNIRYAESYQREFGGDCKTKDECDCGKLPFMASPQCNAQLHKCMKDGLDIRCFGKPDGYKLPDGWTCYKGSIKVGWCKLKTGGTPLLCSPGNCTAYSSASYELAGLLLAALETPNGVYTDMDLGQYALPARETYQSLTYPPVTTSPKQHVDAMKLSDALTVQGNSSVFGGKGTLVFAQNPTVLGWTCGHMIGTAGDVAKFFFDLLDPNSIRIVSNASRSEMKRLQPISLGWGGGNLKYGAGLMIAPVSRNSAYQPNTTDQWGYYYGHGGMTYGFSSQQGYLEPAKAGFSITSNTDIPSFSSEALCKMIEIAATVVDGKEISLNCDATGPHTTEMFARAHWSQHVSNSMAVAEYADFPQEVVV